MVRTVAFVIAASVTLAATAAAGAFFRLDIGSPHEGSSHSGVSEDVLVVQSLCCDAAIVTVTATAEGVVNGRRVSEPVQLQPLSTPGAYAVPRLRRHGQWVLTVTGTCAERNATASIVVPLDGGKAGFVRSRAQFHTRVATAADIDAALRTSSAAD